MATYKQIQDWVKQNYGWHVKTCWIAHCKERAGFAMRSAPNRQGSVRKYPCPSNREEAIFDAFRYFGIKP